MGYGPKLPLCKPKVGARDTLNHREFKDSFGTWPNGVLVNIPLCALKKDNVSYSSREREEKLLHTSVPLNRPT
jgi:hypothetical protein